MGYPTFFTQRRIAKRTDGTGVYYKPQYLKGASWKDFDKYSVYTREEAEKLIREYCTTPKEEYIYLSKNG